MWFNLLAVIATIKKQHHQPIQPNPWSFKRTKEAAQHNSQLLEKASFDMEKATQFPHNTSLSYGSEFRPTTTIKPLLHRHPQWSKVEEILSKGAIYHLDPITEEDRLNDIQHMILRGNHQSAKIEENKAALSKSFDKEVAAQWAIPIQIESTQKIPHACVTPWKLR